MTVESTALPQLSRKKVPALGAVQRYQSEPLPPLTPETCCPSFSWRLALKLLPAISIGSGTAVRSWASAKSSLVGRVRIRSAIVPWSERTPATAIR